MERIVKAKHHHTTLPSLPHRISSEGNASLLPVTLVIAPYRASTIDGHVSSGTCPRPRKNTDYQTPTEFGPRRISFCKATDTLTILPFGGFPSRSMQGHVRST